MQALCNGGEDCLESNAEALCNQCHAAKTLRERIEWEKRRSEAIIRAKQEEKAPPQKPLQGNRSLLDAEPGSDVLENRFLRFAYTRTNRR